MASRKKRPARGRSTTGTARSGGRRRAGGRSGRARKAIRRLWSWRLAGVALLLVAAWALFEGVVVYSQFEGRRWSLPARVYASAPELYAGQAMAPGRFQALLEQLGYRRAEGSSPGPGSWHRQGGSFRVHTRDFHFWDGPADARVLQVDFLPDRVARIRTAAGEELPLLRLDPLEIGSIFPAHGEDRIVLTPEQVPALLADALVAVEDRDFHDHAGLDFSAIARAAWVNLKAGSVRQGGSTLTQQLVKNYFLDSRRTVGRKLREAVMALWLDALYTKEEILTAYVNEVYLGQDGRRAVHGFGLAARFYFGRPITELDLHETLLLVALVRGPSYYNPWTQPGRARERRDLVLGILAQQGVVAEDVAKAAASRPVELARAGARDGYYPAFLDLVRRQLARDYREGDLEAEGLKVFTSLEPDAQAHAESALTGGLERLGRDRSGLEELEGAVVVTRAQTGEVLALVGGRRTRFDGYNRALDAARPIGSLVKPAVYLAALESGRHLASRVMDEPVALRLENGQTWRPGNYSGEPRGEVTLVRALAESLNLATVNLGLEVGVQAVHDVLLRLGLEREVPAYPSLLLGAVELTPVEVAALYTTLAADGFRTPLRAVREVTTGDGSPLGRYGLEVSAAFSPGDVFQLNTGLVQVMERGTGRRARDLLPEGHAVAGKSGTSDEFRDSWFAGYSGDNLAVVWLGFDDNRGTGLSGSAGALPIWSELMAGLGGAPFAPVAPAEVSEVWVDYWTGELAAPGCGDVVWIGVPTEARLPVREGCGPMRGVAEKVRDWLKRFGN